MAYSIQEAKLKSESDKTLAKAEAQKQEMRDRINELRRAFKELLDKNDQLVPRLRLGKDVISKDIKAPNSHPPINLLPQ